MAAISFKAMGPGEGLRPQVEPQLVEYGELKAIKDAGNLIPGQWYRITDYVTTTMQTNTQSAGHQFDILVMATGKTTLCEKAFAVQHEGDEYFADSKLEAWELRYTPENVQWSKQKGATVFEEDDWPLTMAGTVTIEGGEYILWKAGQELYDDSEVEWAVSTDAEVGTELLQYDAESGMIVEDGWVSEIIRTMISDEDGTGTILWMKDEWGNECPYDFKNIQFKRWKVTDEMSGRQGMNGSYLGVYAFCPFGLSISDETDFVWVYTFSTDAGTAADASLGGACSLNVILPMSDGSIPDNVFYKQALGNRIGSNCSHNTFGDYFEENYIGNKCRSNVFGAECRYNHVGDNSAQNSIGKSSSNTSFGASFSQNVIRGGFSYNTVGNNCTLNEWVDVTASYIGDNVSKTTISTQFVKNVQILNGVTQLSTGKLEIGFTGGKNYTQVACLNSNGQLVIYVPGDVGGGGDPQDVLFAYLNERLTDIGSNQTIKELVCIYGEGDGTQASVLGFLTDGELYYPMFNSVDHGFAFVIGGAIDATTDQFVITAVNGSDEIDSDVYNTIEGSVDGVFLYDDAQGSQLDHLASYLVGKKLNIFYC